MWSAAIASRTPRSPAQARENGRSVTAILMKALRQLGFLKLASARRPSLMRTVASSRCSATAQSSRSPTAALQDEIYRLKDRIKQQEGATPRVQDMLSTLEGELGTPEAGLPGAGVLPAAAPVAGGARTHQAVGRRPRAPAGGTRAARPSRANTTASSSRAARPLKLSLQRPRTCTWKRMRSSRRCASSVSG